MSLLPAKVTAPAGDTLADALIDSAPLTAFTAFAVIITLEAISDATFRVLTALVLCAVVLPMADVPLNVRAPVADVVVEAAIALST